MFGLALAFAAFVDFQIQHATDARNREHEAAYFISTATNGIKKIDDATDDLMKVDLPPQTSAKLPVWMNDYRTQANKQFWAVFYGKTGFYYYIKGPPHFQRCAANHSHS